MALFNNYSFNFGFLCGMSNRLVPKFPFIPVWGRFSFWNNCGCDIPLPPPMPLPPPPMPMFNFSAAPQMMPSVFTPTPIGNQFNFNTNSASVWNSNFAQNGMSNFSLPRFQATNNWQMPMWGRFQMPIWGNNTVKSTSNLSTKFKVSGKNIIPEGYNREKG